jgi:hypothetical protein
MNIDVILHKSGSSHGLEPLFVGDKNNLTYRRTDTLFKTTNVRKFLSEFGFVGLMDFLD